MEPELQRSKVDVEQLMTLINKEKGAAEEKLAALLPVEAEAERAVGECETLRAECEEALAEVLPPLMAALRELASIDKGSVAELKAMRAPPTGVKLVLRCLCIMLGRWPQKVLDGKVRPAIARVGMEGGCRLAIGA